MIMALLPIVLDQNRAPHLPHFLQFLETSTATVITLDQWDSFLQFNSTVPVGLEGLEDDGACKTKTPISAYIFCFTEMNSPKECLLLLLHSSCSDRLLLFVRRAVAVG